MESPTLIVNVTITKSTRTVSGLAFNVPVILGPSNRFSDAYRSYVSPQDMISDGFELSDPEYIEALALMSQAGQSLQGFSSQNSAQPWLWSIPSRLERLLPGININSPWIAL